MAIGPFWQESEIDILSLIFFKVKAQVKIDGHIWGLSFNLYVC